MESGATFLCPPGPRRVTIPFQPKRRIGMRRLTALTVLLATTLVLRGQDAPKDKDFDVPKSWTLSVDVVDKASGEPMPGMTLSVREDNQTRAYATDARGHADVEYTDGVKYLTIGLKPAGDVAENISCRASRSS
jgi:hypothetical protein